MNIISIGIAAASVVTGLAGAGVAYELATVDRPGTSASAPAAEAGEQEVEKRVRWKPCEPPAKRVGRACVTKQVRLVAIGGTTSVGTGAVVSRSDDDAPDGFDDRDDDEAFDDDRFEDDGDDDEQGEDRDDDGDDDGDDDDDFDDDSSGHGSGDDDDDRDDDDGDDD